jgi:serine/threonine-protein kinase
VPPQFDELVASATARNPADRFADAAEMVAELEAIGEELNLPPFRVPAPRNSAQHHAAEVFHSQVVEERTTAVTTDRTPAPQPILPVRTPQPAQPPLKHTREFTREERPRENLPAPPQSEHFAGIELSEFEWARQRGKRALLLWVLTILILTGLVAAGAWTLGSNLTGLL